jgi:glycosyltransferase involved in cell wall biosynthesis
MLDEVTINNRYSHAYFINNPIGSSSINIVSQIDYGLQPLISIIIPVHNQESIISRNIQAILENTTDMYYELIIIIDSCSDGTKENVMNFVETELQCNKAHIFLTGIIVLNSELPLFETCADNLGFFCSSAQYSLEIQADMQMTEYGYNVRLMRPFQLNNNVIGISGRCCHTFSENQGIGKLGRDIEQPLSNLPHIDKAYWYISETCNRGPLLIDNDKLRMLGYLDEVNYFLDDSDHDLFARAFVQKKWICGYVPIDFSAPLVDGSTRKPKNKINSSYYELYNRTKTGDGFLKEYLSLGYPSKPLIKTLL